MLSGTHLLFVSLSLRNVYLGAFPILIELFFYSWLIYVPYKFWLFVPIRCVVLRIYLYLWVCSSLQLPTCKAFTFISASVLLGLAECLSFQRVPNICYCSTLPSYVFTMPLKPSQVCRALRYSQISSVKTNSVQWVGRDTSTSTQQNFIATFKSSVTWWCVQIHWPLFFAW